MSTKKKTNQLPRFVDGLGRKKINCPKCIELKNKWKNQLAKERMTVGFDGASSVTLRRMPVVCPEHRKVKRRYGSGITRRKWKQNENKKGFSKKSIKKVDIAP